MPATCPEDQMKVTDILFRLGEKAEALKGYLNALALRQELVAASPDDAKLRRTGFRGQDNGSKTFCLLTRSSFVVSEGS